MADDSIDVKLGASDEGLSEGLNQAAEQTTESTKSMSDAFEALRERVSSAMEGVGEAIREGLAESKEQINETKESLEGFAQSINGIQKMMGLIGEVAAFGFIGEQVADLAKEFAEWGDQMEKTRSETGLTVQSVQELQFAGKNAGVSAQDMDMAMVHLSRSLGAAREGNQQSIDSYKALGISMDDLKGVGLDGALEKIAQAFNEHADGANKAALAMQLFGRSGADMIAFLDQGKSGIDDLRARAEQLGIVFGDEDVEQAAKLNAAFVQMDAQMDAAKKRAGEELAPSFLQIASAMDTVSQKGGPLNEFFQALATVLKAGISVGISFIGVFEEIAEAIGGAASAAYLAARGEFSAASAAISISIDNIKKKAEDTDEALRKLWSSAKAPETPKSEEGGGTKPDFTLPNRSRDENANKLAEAERQLQDAQNNAALALTKEHLSEETALYEDEYKNGLMSLQDYYAKRLETQRAGLEAERSAKDADLKSAQQTTGTARQSGNEAAVTEALAKEASLKGEIAVLDAKLADLGPENARAEADAQKKLNDELALTNIEKDQNVAKSNANTAKANAEAEYDAGMITKQQLTALEMQSTQEMYEIDRDALEKKAQLYQQDVQKYAQAQAQIAELDAQHQAQMAQLQARATAEQMKDAKQATDDIEQGFSRAFASFADGSETARQAFDKFITSIDQQLTQLISKDLFNKLFQMGGDNSINSTLTGWMSKLFGGSGGVGQATQDVATTANTTALTTLTTAVMQLATEIMAGGGSGGGLSALLSSVVGGGGDVAGGFGFTTSLTGSADAVAGGAVAEGGGGMSALMGLASFDVGSPYIPTDMVAQIHKGEAIIPAHLNSPYNPNNVAVTNNFVVPGGADLRTQSQIFAMAGAGIQRALQRNG